MTEFSGWLFYVFHWSHGVSGWTGLGGMMSAYRCARPVLLVVDA